MNYIEPSEEEIELYEPVPVDPVKQSKVKCDKPIVYREYESYDLDYYEENYIQYFSYVNGPRYQEMKHDLNNNSKVCYNVDVVNNNGTVMGAFTCPLHFEDKDLTSCCGSKCAQFCCSPNQYTQRENDLNTLAFGLILGSAFGLGLLFYYVLGSMF